MKTYVIPVEWMYVADVKVEAKSLKEAIEKVINSPHLPDGEFLNDSFRVNEDLLSETNDGLDEADLEYLNK